VYEDFNDDLVRQREDRVLVGVKAGAHHLFFGLQFSKSALEIQDLGVNLCEAGTVCYK
jgi:hypothetical protein